MASRFSIGKINNELHVDMLKVGCAYAEGERGKGMGLYVNVIHLSVGLSVHRAFTRFTRSKSDWFQCVPVGDNS